jgi:hypothetical protein
VLGVVVAAGCARDVDSVTAPAAGRPSPNGPNANIVDLTTAQVHYSQSSALNDLRGFSGDNTLAPLAADDFIVPDGQVWTVTAVALSGHLYATALALSIRPDDNGVPGAPLPNASFTRIPTASAPNECGCEWYGATVMDYLVPLPAPITLTAGKYWLAVKTGDPGDVLTFAWQVHAPAVGSSTAYWGVLDNPSWSESGAPGDAAFAVFGTTKPTQTITFTSTAPSPVYPAQSYTVSATGGLSGNPVTFSSLTPNNCSVSGSTVLFLGWGDCTIAADQAGNGAYGAAPQATQTIGISRYNQTVTFTPALPASAPLGSQITLSATGGASGNPIVFSADIGQPCSVVGGVLTLTWGGMCTVNAFQAGDAMYEPAGAQVTIAVLWPFTGFVGLSAEPAVNVARGDSSIPLTFSLGGNRGLSVLAAGSPTVAPYVCGGTVPAPGSGIALPLAKNGALSYSTKTGQYTITYKPEKRPQDCRLVSITLSDGTIHTVRFRMQ